MVVKRDKKNKIIWTSSTTSSQAGGAAMKYRPPRETPREETKGKLPCAEAASVQQVILMMVVHLCRKVLYGLDVSYRVCIYVLGILMISVVSDYKTPTANRSYFAQSDNFLNSWFAKCAWFWTGLLLSSFIYMTSNTYSCGRVGVIKNNLSRLAIASIVWYSVTSFFQVVEAKTGVCELTRYHRKESCLSHGHLWRGFDLSGHCFLLIFCNLVMHEEGKAYLGWERIKDHIRTEEHKRVADDTSRADTPLSKLKNEEFLALRTLYPKNTPVVRLLFCLMALLTLLWDFMLLITVLYYHMMIEKVVASGVAVLAWFGLYKFIYKQSLSPGLPGEGIFKYVAWKDPVTQLGRRQGQTCSRHRSSENKWSSKDDVPRFMGMPLYGLNTKEYKEEKLKEDLTEEEVFYLNGLGGSRPSMSSMASMSSMERLKGRRTSLADIRAGPRARSRSQSKSRIASRDGIGKNKLNHVNPVHL